MERPPPHRDGVFHTTSWSLIARAAEPGQAAALTTLCQTYWQPLYIYARRSGLDIHQAEDLVQDFFTHIIEQDFFSRADASRGRFRTFLLSSLQQFIARSHRHNSRQKRSPGAPLLSLDLDSGERALASAPASPVHAFDRAWALSQLDFTWQRLQSTFAHAGKSDLFDRLRAVIAGHSTTPVREIASSLGMTEGAVNVAAHRLRKQFAECLREQVALTLESTDSLDQEIADLLAALAPA